MPSEAPKVYLITGGSSGLGLETARSLASKDSNVTVVMAGRVWTNWASGCLVLVSIASCRLWLDPSALSTTSSSASASVATSDCSS